MSAKSSDITHEAICTVCMKKQATIYLEELRERRQFVKIGVLFTSGLYSYIKDLSPVTVLYRSSNHRVRIFLSNSNYVGSSDKCF